ncbi:hypothetical protein [Corynebacterium sp. AOP12-C2-36]|uniref:hypothetical protein n=1 Tax=Corynebacterium sp. AOP12-C2-36 TaxID=3457723 RepID=UPI0040348D82
MTTNNASFPVFFNNTDAARLAGVSRRTMLRPTRLGKPSPYTDNAGRPVDPMPRLGNQTSWRWPAARLIEALHLTDDEARALLAEPDRASA